MRRMSSYTQNKDRYREIISQRDLRDVFLDLQLS